MALQLVLWLAHTHVIRHIWVWGSSSLLFICSGKTFYNEFYCFLLSSPSLISKFKADCSVNLLMDIFVLSALYMNRALWVIVSYLSSSFSLSKFRYAEQNHWIWTLLFLAGKKKGFGFEYLSFSVWYFWRVSWLKSPGITRTWNDDFGITKLWLFWLGHGSLLVFIYREGHYIVSKSLA